MILGIIFCDFDFLALDIFEIRAFNFLSYFKKISDKILFLISFCT